MTVGENVAILKLKVHQAPVENKDRIEKLINLYSTRKIRDVRTARSLIYALAGNRYQRNPNAVIERYEAVVAQCAGDEPVPEPPTDDSQPKAIERMPAVIGVQAALLYMLAAFAIGVSFHCPGSFFFG